MPRTCATVPTALAAVLFAALCLTGNTVTRAAAQQTSAKKPRLNRFIETIGEGRVAYTSPDVANASKGNWLFIDMEHGLYLLDRLEKTLSELTRGSQPPSLTPVVRIPLEGDEDFRWAVKQVLDLGVFGIVFPHIENKAQAITAVRAMRYPPQRNTRYPMPRGQRGFGPGRAARYWGLDVNDYIERADVWPLNPDGELVALVMIETPEAVKNIDEILQVPGVLPFFGPGDMALAMGVHAAPAEVEPVVETVAKACSAHKVTCGIAVDLNDETLKKKRVAQGFKFMGTSMKKTP